MHLIIVESPTKAKTFNKYLNNSKYRVISSMGHIRDLPKKKLGVDIENNFEPEYEVMADKAKIISEIVKNSRQAKRIILATDRDREGEAIAYHIVQVLKDKIKKKMNFVRISFHEITKEALEEALENTRHIDRSLFDAQQARRVLDRIVGYKISPYLWKKYSKRWLSAGRVQTVALRFIVEREKERKKFSSQGFYAIKGEFKNGKAIPIAKLIKLKGKPFYKSNKIVLYDGQYEYQFSSIRDEATSSKEKKRLEKEQYIVEDIIETKTQKTPPPPFITSTLQQYGSTNCGYTAKRTMRLAQLLYEKGLITYHRTDSLSLSVKFVKQITDYVLAKYGKDYVLAKPRFYKTKSKLVQEAHEAIRPTKTQNSPDSNKIGKLRQDEKRIYEAIYNRTLATQMKGAEVLNQRIKIASQAKDLFQVSLQKVLFPGFLILYSDQDKADLILKLNKDTLLKLKQLLIEEKETLPPPRYSEATLIKTLEARGIGRPSTYAPIVTLIQLRQYVEKKVRELVPSELGISITDLLVAKFEDIFESNFTAEMEQGLDSIVHKKAVWKDVVAKFFSPFSKKLDEAYKDIEKIKIEEKTTEKCPECSAKLVIKLSRFGKFYACTNFPECKYTKSFLTKIEVVCPECQKGQLVVRYSRKKRRFYACDQYPECKYTSLWLPKVEKK